MCRCCLVLLVCLITGLYRVSSIYDSPIAHRQVGSHICCILASFCFESHSKRDSCIIALKTDFYVIFFLHKQYRIFRRNAYALRVYSSILFVISLRCLLRGIVKIVNANTVISTGMVQPRLRSAPKRIRGCSALVGWCCTRAGKACITVSTKQMSLDAGSRLLCIGMMLELSPSHTCYWVCMRNGNRINYYFVSLEPRCISSGHSMSLSMP